MWYAPKGDTELRHWSNYVRDVVEHYNKGRVSHFEVWNEPNVLPFWNPHPNVAEYVTLLREAYLSVTDTYPKVRSCLVGFQRIIRGT